jgi:hypothetical protein
VSPPEPPSEAELVGVGKMLGTTWKIIGERFRRRPLTSSEERELAEAAIPVLTKYGGGFLEQYGAEISLGIVAIGLWDGTKLPEPKALPEDKKLEQGEAA